MALYRLVCALGHQSLVTMLTRCGLDAAWVFLGGSVEWRWKAGEYQQRWRGLHLGNLDVLARTSLSAIVSAPEPTPIFGLFRQSR